MIVISDASVNTLAAITVSDQDPVIWFLINL